jgi:hypothetical protein
MIITIIIMIDDDSSNNDEKKLIVMMIMMLMIITWANLYMCLHHHISLVSNPKGLVSLCSEVKNNVLAIPGE